MLGAAPPSWRDAAADLAALKEPKVWLGLTWEERGGGVVVKVAHPGGPADAPGLRVGDRIVAVGDTPVSSDAAIGAAIDAVGASAPLRFTIERGGTRADVAVTRGPTDPLLFGLFAAGKAQECRSVSLMAPDAALRQRVESAAFDGARAFRCEDAHRVLADAAPPGTVLVVRGGTRVLVVAPGSGSRCVSVAEADGAAPAVVARWLDEITRAYAADRHANP